MSFCARGWGAGEGLGGAAVREALVGEAFPRARSISTGAKIDFATVGRPARLGFVGRGARLFPSAIPPRARGETPYAAPTAIGCCNRANTPILLSHTVKGMVSWDSVGGKIKIPDLHSKAGRLFDRFWKCKNFEAIDIGSGRLLCRFNSAERVENWINYGERPLYDRAVAQAALLKHNVIDQDFTTVL